jgi:hypothetical protein
VSIFDSIRDGFKKAGEETVGAIGKIAGGDTFYPDNPHREARAKELALDVSQVSYRLAADNAQVKTNLVNLNTTIEEVYRAGGFTPPAAANAGTVEFHETAYTVSEFVAPMLAISAVRYAMADTAVVGEAESGEIGSAAAAEALGAEGVELGFGPGLVIVAGVTAIIGAVQGADKRSKLQDYIHKSFALRQRLKTGELLDARLVNALAGASASIAVLRGIGLTEAQLTTAIQQIIAAAEKALKVDVSADARAQLAGLDHSRGSWTNEDT